MGIDVVTLALARKMSGSGVSGKVDWNQNDPTGAGYIKNRTHWEEEKTKTLASLQGVYDGGWNYIQYDTTNLSSIWEQGKEVLIKWNNIEYNLVVRWDRVIGYNGVGNFSCHYPSSEDTGEPFAIYINAFGSDECGFIVAVKEEGVEASWELLAKEKIVHTINPKFLPTLTETKTTIFHIDGVQTESIAVNPKNIKLVGQYQIKIDGEVQEINFVDQGDFSLASTPAYEIVSFEAFVDTETNEENPAGFHFVFPDDEYHTITINEIKQTIKEDYLPDQIKTNPDWDEVDSNSLSYIQNKPFGKFGNILVNYDIFESSASIPEAEYEIGKVYSISINDKIYDLEFVAAFLTGYQKYAVGFNIKEGNQGAPPKDESLPRIYLIGFSPSEVKRGSKIVCSLIYEDYYKSYPINLKIISDNFVKQIDPKYIKDMYYEEEVKDSVDIENVTYSAKKVGATSFENPIFYSHGATLPLQLGQTWSIDVGIWSSISEVKQASDGTLFIGCHPENGPGEEPYCLTQTEAWIASGWNDNKYASDFTIIGITNSKKSIIHYIDPKYIKDMYSEKEEQVFQVENAEFVDNTYLCEPSFSISTDNTYIVNWDGEEYICEAYVFQNTPAIGNTAPFGGFGNDEPFCIGYDKIENMTFVNGFDDLTSHTFSVIEKICNKIPTKYLPILKETQETIIETEITNWIELIGAEYKKLLGKHIVVIDGVPETVEFIDEGIYSFVETDSFIIESWTDPDGLEYNNGFYMGFSNQDDTTHSVQIIGFKEIIKEEYLPQSDWNQNETTASDFIKNRPFYEVPERWISAQLIPDDWGSKATCMLVFPTEGLTEEGPYRVRVDGIEYDFEELEVFAGSNATSMKPVYYLGEDYAPLNSSMDFSTYPFCILTQDFVDFCAVFEDGGLGHTVEFFVGESKIHYLDPKFIKDMYYEKEENVPVLSFNFTLPSNPDEFSYLTQELSMEDATIFRELVDNNVKVTIDINGEKYVLESRGFSNGYYRLYYNDGEAFSHYIGGNTRNLVFYFRSFDLSEPMADVQVTFYKTDLIINQIQEKFIPDSIARVEDAIISPHLAEVGQTIVVKAVDENGKPTEWEMADLPLDPIVLEVYSSYNESLDKEEFSWTQNYSFEKIYEAAKKGKLSCYMFIANGPDAETWDSLFAARLEAIGLENHPSNRFVQFVDPLGQCLIWNANGFFVEEP